ncbi:putative hydroxymethylpyrimidine transporter CytX [Salinisphaera sp. SPP-AMP-43]|uniref:putative hydroxymethylpyrimidine transporter CytX n=1 Tax=Salinisphaera sp. SPP-AMP-43 TaxID=3121288 RepID=UPI003C6E0C28
MYLRRDLPFFFLWFGAAVSLSEILAGTLLAPLGLTQGLIAIVLGHVIGTTLLVLGGLIGTREGQSAMGTTEAAFGPLGRRLFAGLNVLQLIGWTAVMLATGADQAAGLASGPAAIWVVLLAGLVAGWAMFARAGIGHLNTVAVALLMGLLFAVFFRLFYAPEPASTGATTPMRFGTGLELVIVMPLSWLPLIADYNRHAHRPGVASVFTWAGYALGSAWMYAIGLWMAVHFGGLNLGALVAGAPAVAGALVVVVLSTVTTTFLDVYSAGVSARHMGLAGPIRGLAVGVALLGTVLALWVPIGAYEGFLYAIGALFSPLYAVVLTRYFVLRRSAVRSRFVAIPALAVWGIGVAAYYGFAAVGTPIGATLPAFMLTAVLYTLICIARPAARD